MSIIDTLVKRSFVAHVADIEQLARLVHDGVRGTGTYLACLVVACQARLGKPRRRNAESQTAVVDVAHKEFYGAVLRGVADENSDDAENNRRATFARTAASTLRSYVKAGGDLRQLDATTVTKGSLRRAVQPPEPSERLARRWTRAHAGLLRIARRMVKVNPDFAADGLQMLVDELTEMLDELPDVGGATTAIATGVRAPPVTRVGDRPGAMLHSPA